jgi:CRISPR type III-A-associated RAMP protein Csm4
MSVLEIRLQPLGPWRAGHPAGERDRVDAVYHSDALFSAVTHAMKSLGWLEEWLAATVLNAAGSAVRFSSLFPVAGGVRLIPPPRTAWPPSGSGKLHAEGVRFVPIEVARHGIASESQWTVDGASACLLPAGAAAPFEVSLRSAAAVDRLSGNTEPHRTAGLEFEPEAGLWGLAEISEEVWEPRVKSALRLLADSGFGGERSLGWGRAAEPQFSDASALFAGPAHSGVWWLLSLYSPHAEDAVDWSRGDYSAVTRAGWTDSTAGAVRKKRVRMIEEGSVIMAPELRGRAVDVAPEGFPHPTWRAGFAPAVPLPQEVEL